MIDSQIIRYDSVLQLFFLEYALGVAMKFTEPKEDKGWHNMLDRHINQSYDEN